jgi:hypothetical protein
MLYLRFTAFDPKRTFNALVRIARQRAKKRSTQRIDIQLASVYREASELDAVLFGGLMSGVT